MPYAVRRVGDMWEILKADTGEVVGHSASKEMAEASIRARIIGEHAHNPAKFKREFSDHADGPDQ